MIYCLTGSIATISQEIVWLIDPAVRANPPSDEARMIDYDAIVAVIAREHPEAIIQRIERPVKSMFAWTVQASYPDIRVVNHYVNPYTGHIQGSEPEGFSFRQFIRALHGWLLMPFTDGFNFGWYAVSALSLPLLGSLITGLVVYKRFWRGYFRPRLRVDRGSRVFWGDLHRLAGIWSILFILIMAVTPTRFAPCNAPTPGCGDREIVRPRGASGDGEQSARATRRAEPGGGGNARADSGHRTFHPVSR